MLLLGGLKTTMRQGWIERKLPARIESVADHSHRMATFIAFAAQFLNKDVDIARATQMALVHDLAEALCGDITPADNMPDAEKNQLERDALLTIVEPLVRVSGKKSAKLLIDLWEEYAGATSVEAQLVKDVDKLEMCVQALEYESDCRLGEPSSKTGNKAVRNGTSQASSSRSERKGAASEQQRSQSRGRSRKPRGGSAASSSSCQPNDDGNGKPWAS